MQQNMTEYVILGTDKEIRCSKDAAEAIENREQNQPKNRTCLKKKETAANQSMKSTIQQRPNLHREQ